jgi:hypothetical protein
MSAIGRTRPFNVRLYDRFCSIHNRTGKMPSGENLLGNPYKAPLAPEREACRRLDWHESV